MPTKWVVTTPSDRVELDENQQGQTTFTVTNPTPKLDRVVFDVVAGDGADASWFTVDEPQRRVPGNGSVSYLMKAAVPVGAKPGDYSVQGRVYSADSAPEEDSVLSSRLAVQVKAAITPPPKKIPWWVYVVVALVVVVAIVVGFVVASGSKSSGPTVNVPNVSNQSQDQATTNLFGLKVGVVRHKLDASPDRVIYQSVPGGAKVARGTTVDLVVTTALAAPVLTKPASGATIPLASLAPPTTPVPTSPVLGATPSPMPSPASADGVLRWTDPDPFVSRWQVEYQQEICTSAQLPPFNGAIVACYYVTSSAVQVNQPEFTPIYVASGSGGNSGILTVPRPIFQWRVSAVDDFGNIGTPSAWFRFTGN
jgi:hypothetical protein